MENFSLAPWDFMRNESYQREQALWFADGATISEKSKKEHQPTNANEDVDALVYELRLRESLKETRISDQVHYIN